MNKPAFSVEEAKAWYRMCRTAADAFELVKLIIEERDCYDLLDYQDLLVAYNLRCWVFRFYAVGFNRSDRIWISDNPIQY